MPFFAGASTVRDMLIFVCFFFVHSALYQNFGSFRLLLFVILLCPRSRFACLHVSSH